MRLIDADSLKTVMCSSVCGFVQPQLCTCGCAQALAIDNAPTIEAEPIRHGHWILPDICYEDIECSVCHAYMPLPISFDYRPTYKYCPMCGAKMDEVSK